MNRNGIEYKFLTTENEVEQMYRLMARKEIGEWTGTPLFPPMIRDAARKKGIIIAKDDDKLIGFIQFTKRKDGFNAIHVRGVAPEYQGRGIASQLTKLIPPPHIAKCKIENVRIQNLYRKFGMHLAEIEIKTASRHGKTHTYKIAVFKTNGY